MLQQSLYAGSPHLTQRFRYCLVASLLDALLVLGIYYRGALVTTDRNRILYVGCFSQARGWWAYAPKIPRIPALQVGALPVLQLAVLPIATLQLFS